VERRLNRPFTTKLPLGGPTWDAFFEHPTEAKEMVLGYCHNRPRDVLIYCSYAIESAQSHRHGIIQIDDLQGARRRFSDNRLKDLGDEYSENYPQIATVLLRFYGLGRRFTLGAMEDFLERLLQDPEVKRLCATWIYEYSSVERFVRLLYNIGFVGLKEPRRGLFFRSLGPRDTTPPAITHRTDVVIHNSYWDALDLQDSLVKSLAQGESFHRVGLLTELPGGLDPLEYAERLDEILVRLDATPHGNKGASDFEDIVGEIIRMCFFRALENVESRVRDGEGRVIRDWIASNRATTGFWELVRVRYQATQIIWECKNYENLSADDFHQANYYMTQAIGKFLILTFRGEVEKSYIEHIRRISSDKQGLVLPLTEKDLRVFVRQARNGKLKEDHIQDRYDKIVRSIS
jgi:hypothetical protein